MKFKIGSFNMYKFSYQSDKEIKKDFDMLAKIIADGKFDIVALQEVFTPDAVQKLVNAHLNKYGKWDYRWEKPRLGVGYSKSTISAEGYAFIWNTKRIELSTTQNPKEYDARKLTRAEPHIFDQYKIDRSLGEKELARNPYYGRFKPVGQFFEIRLINAHIRFSKDEEDLLGATALRRNEFNILSKCIYPKISNRRYGNNMPAYTILLGDYNLELNRDWTHGPYLTDPRDSDPLRKDAIIYYDFPVQKYEGDTPIGREDARHEIITVQESLTTLKCSPDEQEDDPAIKGFSHNYDHFSYDRIRFKGVSLTPGVINTLNKYYQNDDDKFAKHRKEVSDHMPITLTLDVNPAKIK